MSYREPTHGWWCNARTYPTRCRQCGAEVFYFSCDCGSKVFFDSLGWPWPIHDCVSSILGQVEASIAEEYARCVAERQDRRRRGWQSPIEAHRPEQGEDLRELGIVREILPRVDVYKKLDLPPDTPISVGLLGRLASGNWGQITIHVDDASSEYLSSYTLLVESSTWERLGAQRGDLVYFTAVGQSIPGRQTYWLCTSLECLGNHP